MTSPIKIFTAFLLKHIDPHKPFGTALFDAIARVSVSVAFEAVALRRNSETGEQEVYMVQRSMDDTAYPGQWHVPGSVIRPHERDERVFVRLSKREFGANIVKSRFRAMLSHPGEARGHFISLVYKVTLDGEPTKGKWFSIHKLPPHTVMSHRHYIIPIAADDKKFEGITHVKIKNLEI